MQMSKKVIELGNNLDVNHVLLALTVTTIY